MKGRIFAEPYIMEAADNRCHPAGIGDTLPTVALLLAPPSLPPSFGASNLKNDPSNDYKMKPTPFGGPGQTPVSVRMLVFTPTFPREMFPFSPNRSKRPQNQG